MINSLQFLILLVFLSFNTTKTTFAYLQSKSELVGANSLSASPPFPSAELSALYDLFTSTNGENWRWESSSNGAHWNFTNPAVNPCMEHWQGVGCICESNYSNCIVSSLSLQGYYMEGTLPNTLGNLTYLQVLDLSHNHLRGSLPTVWPVRNFTYLVLHENTLQFSIPSSLWQLSQLERLDLSANELTGHLSSEVSNLQLLRYLSVAANFHDGPLPSTLTDLPLLEELMLEGNHFSGVLSSLQWSQLQSLVLLRANTNNLRGELPGDVLTLPLLQEIDISTNHFTGSIPEFFSSSLRILIASANNITGTLSPMIMELPVLSVLSLATNKLYGSLPDFRYATSNLSVISIGNNNFTGTVPSAWWNMRNLTALLVDGNHLYGNLTRLPQLESLRMVVLSRNSFSGSFPPAFYYMSNLEFVDINTNLITGRLPSDYSGWPHVRWIDISNNLISGSLSESIGNLTNLRVISCDRNLITGTIPSGFGQISNLSRVFLEGNGLHGTIPTAFNKLQFIIGIFVSANELTGAPIGSFNESGRMLYFGLQYNQFTGALPVSDKWRNIAYYNTFANFFEGSIPIPPHQATRLYYFNVMQNSITGTIPLWVNSTILFYFYAGRSLISGTIPPLAENLLAFWVERAQVHGTIPDSLGNAKQMKSFRVNNNFMTGTIPSFLSELRDLQTLSLENNMFTGSIDHFIDPGKQLSLEEVQISSNFFTGTLSPAFFNSTSLESFAVSSNCISGSIPEEICHATKLTSLDLDGLATATRCRANFLSNLLPKSAFMLKKPLEGGIPACLFALPNMQSLHVSGNGLVGSLPYDMEVSPSLINVSIAHNQLTGSLPWGLQTTGFYNLDVSYNKFTGTLVPESAPVCGNCSFFAERNRFSGDFPESLVPAENITILDGNIFNCKWDKSNLPQGDPKYATYSCGSDDVYISFFAWVAIWPFAFASLLCIYNVKQRDRQQRKLKKMQKELEESQQQEQYTQQQRRSSQNEDGAGEDSLSADIRMSPSFVRAQQTATSSRGRSDTTTSELAAERATGAAVGRRSSGFFLTTSAVSARGSQVMATVAAMRRQTVQWRQATLDTAPADPQLSDSKGEDSNDKTTNSTVSGSFAERSQISANSSLLAVLTLLSANSFQTVNVLDLVSTLELLKRVVLVLGGFSLFVVWPMVTILSVYYRTYTFMYMWSYSALLKSGDLPATLLSVMFCVVLWLTWHMLIRERKTRLFDGQEHFGPRSQMAYHFVFVIVNVVVMLIINFLYVLAVERVDDVTLFFLEYSLALVKVLWNELVAIRNFNALKQLFFRRICFSKFQYERDRATLADYLVQTAIIVINLLLIPTLAQAFASSNCLYNFLNPPTTQTGGFQLEECDVNIPIAFRLLCYSETIVYYAISYQAPFLYSYQCASFIIINYAPVYIFLMVLIGVIIPLGKILLRVSYDRLDDSSVNKRWLAQWLPRTLLPIKSHLHSKRMISVASTTANTRSSRSKSNARLEEGTASEEADADAEDDVEEEPQAATPDAPPRIHRKPLLDAKVLPLRLNSYLAVFLTFGVTFPPMAIPIALGIAVFLTFEIWLLGRFLYISEQASRASLMQYRTELRQENSEALRYLTQPVLLWFTLTCVSSIYAFLIFDTSGDGRNSAQPTTWGLFSLVLCFPSLLLLVYAWAYGELSVHWCSKRTADESARGSVRSGSSSSWASSQSGGSSLWSASRGLWVQLRELFTSQDKTAASASSQASEAASTTHTANPILGSTSRDTS